jgi:type II secretory pathway pseudopilin PulG
MMSAAPSRRVKPSEEGYILVAVMIMVALLIISMAVAVPKVASDIQRDRELETYHRGMQYRRAIQLYFRKFQRYPPNVDALVKTNEIRFLRKKYIDPTTGKDDWKPVLFGQNKTPMAMGLFGQPLGGIGFGGGVLAGTGPAGAMESPAPARLAARLLALRTRSEADPSAPQTPSEAGQSALRTRWGVGLTTSVDLPRRILPAERTPTAIPRIPTPDQALAATRPRGRYLAAEPA